LYYRTPPLPRSGRPEFPASVKVTVVFAFTTIAIFAGHWLAMFKLADRDLPVNPLFVVATIFEAITLVLCLELVIFGLAVVISARLRRLSMAQPEKHGS